MYAINFCQNVISECKGLGNQFMALKLATDLEVPVPCYYLTQSANHTKIEFEALNDGDVNFGIMLIYPNGEPYEKKGQIIYRETKLIVYCDPFITGFPFIQFRFVQHDGLVDYYLFETHHVAGCEK